jgi:glycine oxidase
MGHTSDVAIIGGGAAGCATAYYLAKAGVQATIIERAGVATQASGYAAGELTPLQGFGIPGPLEPLARESFTLQLELFDRLQEEAGVDFHPRTVSVLKVAFDESEIAALQESLAVFQAADGFTAQGLKIEEIVKVEPRLSPHIIQAVCLFGNAVVDSYLYTSALFKAAASRGTALRLARAVGLKISGGRVTAVRLTDGELACDHVIIASGPWAGEAESWLRIAIPVEPLKGEILRVALPGPALGCELESADVSLGQRADGLIWVGATEERCGFDTQPSEAARDKLLAAAVRLMPAVSAARIMQHTACLRPATSDWLPIIGKASGWENVYLATGGRKKGILLAAGMGQALADLIANGRTHLSIDPFAPGRFATSSVEEASR